MSKRRVRECISAGAKAQGLTPREYGNLHQRMRRRIPKPAHCVMCQDRKPIDMANKGVYDENPDNWEWLCRKCHFRKDGINEAFQERNSRIRLSDISCRACGRVFRPNYSVTVFCDRVCANVYNGCVRKEQK